MSKVSKRSVNYRKKPYSWGGRRCGNCSMFTRAKAGPGGTGSCTLVAGEIRPQDICDRWDWAWAGRRGSWRSR